MEGGIGPAVKGEEMAQPPIGKRIEALVKGAEGEPKTRLSWTAEQKDLWGGFGLNQIEEAAPTVADAARYTASAIPKAQKLVANAIPKLAEALKGGVAEVENFFTALSESRLRGIIEKYDAMADWVGRSEEGALLESAKKGLFEKAVNAIDGRRGFENRDLVDELSTAIWDAENRGEVQALRDFLTSTFETARGNVGESVLVNGEKFEDYVARPEVKKALRIYKDLLEEPLREAHKLNEGYFSKQLGPLDTYFPLSQTPDTGVRTTSGTRPAYQKPKNPGNHFATGLSDQYDTGIDAFRGALARSIRLNGRAGLMNELESQQLMKRMGPGQTAPSTMKWRGVEYETETVEVGPRMLISKDGKPLHVPPAKAVVPKWVAKELGTILVGDPRLEESTFSKILHGITAFNMGGPTDAVYHTANLVGTLILRAPIVGTDILSKAASATPFTKFAAGLANIIAVRPTDARWASRYMEMVENGQIPTRAGSVTYSKKIARETGAEKVSFLQLPWHRDTAGKLRGRSPLDFSPIVFGPNGIDIRCRLLLDVIGEHIAERSGIEMTKSERFEFTRMLGNYVFELEGRIERAAKSTGLSPFYTAGRQMNMNGIAGMLGVGHLPVGEGMKAQTFNRYRALQMTSGLVGLTATWAVANKLYRGKWPWEDDESRLFQIAIKPEDREGRLARAIWGDDLDRTGWVNLGFFSPLIARGLRVTGLRAQIENRMKGMPGWKAEEQSMLDTLNGWTHPFLGPPARMATAALGFEPYIQSMTTAGRATPQFKPVVRGRIERGLKGRLQIAKAMAIQANPIFRRIETGHQEAHPATRVIADTMLPNLFGGPYRAQDTPLEVLIRESTPPSMAKTPRQLEEADVAHGLTSRLRAAMKNDEAGRVAGIRGEIASAVKEGKIPPHEAQSIQKSATQGKHIRGFQTMNFADAVAGMESATPAEWKELFPSFVKKFRGGKWREDVTQSELEDLTKRAVALFRQGPTRSAYTP
jgi:hypothetical protein